MRMGTNKVTTSRNYLIFREALQRRPVLYIGTIALNIFRTTLFLRETLSWHPELHSDTVDFKILNFFREALLRHPELSMEMDRLSDTLSETGERLPLPNQHRGKIIFPVFMKPINIRWILI